MQVRSLGWEDPLEKGLYFCLEYFASSIFAWRILWTGDPGGLQSMGSQRVGHDRSKLSMYAYPVLETLLFFFWDFKAL